MELLPWEKWWEGTDLDFMRNDPDEANHPIRIRMGNEAERVAKRQIAAGWMPKVLDAGCGTAIDYPRLKALGFRYQGLEPIPKFIDRAIELYPEIRIKQGRIWNIDADDKEFDVTWCKGVVQHLPPGTYPEALDELWRVTETLLMVSTNRMFWAGDNPSITQREKHGPYNNHYNFKEFNRHIHRLKNATSRYIKGFVKRKYLEDAIKKKLVHTLFLVYDRDYWKEHNESD